MQGLLPAIPAIPAIRKQGKALITEIEQIFGGILEIPDKPFAYHLAKFKAHMKQCKHGKNSEWKARFLNRLAPLKIDCYLKYDKPTKKGKRL